MVTAVSTPKHLRPNRMAVCEVKVSCYCLWINMQPRRSPENCLKAEVPLTTKISSLLLFSSDKNKASSSVSGISSLSSQLSCLVLSVSRGHQVQPHPALSSVFNKAHLHYYVSRSSTQSKGQEEERSCSCSSSCPMRDFA